jgi:hypothetical protein
MNKNGRNPVSISKTTSNQRKRQIFRAMLNQQNNVKSAEQH